MLAYNYRKQNPNSKSDPVREILARIEEKQSKTGLSLYTNQDAHALPTFEKTTTGEDQPSSSGARSSFPDVKAARQKAQNRITTNLTSQQTVSPTKNFGAKRTKRAPHRLPGTRVAHLDQSFLPSNFRSTAVMGDEKLSNAYNATDFHLNKDSIDMDINPFGYNRKTLAFDNRNINYVVEWPETWPFKITSFQRKAKPGKTKQRRENRNPFPHKHYTPAPVSSPAPVVLEELPWEQAADHARVLAPVEHPGKPHPLPNKPFLESVRRQTRKPQPRDSKESFYQGYCKEAGVAYKREGPPGHVHKKQKNIPDEETRSKLRPQDSPQRGTGAFMGGGESSPAVSSVESTQQNAEVESSLDNQNSPEKDASTILQQGHCHSNAEHVPPSTPIPRAVLKGEATPEKLAEEMLNDIVNQVLAEDDGMVI